TATLGDGSVTLLKRNPSSYESPDDTAPLPPAAAEQRVTMRLGERLIAKGWVTPEELEAALEAKQRSGGFLGETLLEIGVVSAAQLGSALAEIYGVPYVDLAATAVDAAAV